MNVLELNVNSAHHDLLIGGHRRRRMWPDNIKDDRTETEREGEDVGESEKEKVIAGDARDETWEISPEEDESGNNEDETRVEPRVVGQGEVGQKELRIGILETTETCLRL